MVLLMFALVALVGALDYFEPEVLGIVENDSDVPNLTGEWEYQFHDSRGTSTYEGHAQIKQKGRNVSVFGTRQRIVSSEKNGQKESKVHLSWSSNFGRICGDGKLRADYQLAGQGNVFGYLVLNLVGEPVNELHGTAWGLGSEVAQGKALFLKKSGSTASAGSSIRTG